MNIIIIQLILRFHQQNIRRKMFPQFRMIRDFDLYEEEFGQISRFNAPVFHKDDFLKETQDNELENTKQFSQSRSSKQREFRIETSFDSTMMDQHNLGFKKSLEKFMEKAFPSEKKVQGLEWINTIYNLDEENTLTHKKLTQLVKQDNRLFDQQEKKMFLDDLENQQKLNEFLSSLLKIGHQGLVMELIFVADLFWQAYLPHQEVGLTECEIHDLVENLLNSQNIHRYMEKLQFLNLSKTALKVEIDREEINEALKAFLIQFGVTIFLIVEQYFKNPFSTDCCPMSNLKRTLNFKDISNDQFSDDEDEIMFSFGHKKRNI